MGMARWMVRVAWSLVGILPASILLLWWAGSRQDKHIPEVGRQVFGNIPAPVVALFYVATTVFIGLFAYLFAVRARNWARGADETRRGMWGRRLRELERGLSMRSVMETRSTGLMHAMIYYGFIVLFLGTVTLELDHLAPENLKFLEGRVYQGYSAVLDAFGVVFLVGIGWAAARRWGVRPWRARTKSKPEDVVILGLLALLGLTGFAVEAARISLMGRPDFEVWSFVGYPLASLVPAASASGIHQAAWIVHAVSFLAFLVVLPVTKLRHMITSPLNMALAPHERPKGAMREMPNLVEATDIETIGANRVAEFTWKQLLDTDACTICGRCTSVCPANADRQAARPARDRPQTRRGGRHDRVAADQPAGGPRCGHHRHRRLGVRAHHSRGAVGLHLVPGMRRGLPGRHRDPRQDPRHAPLPVAHGGRLPRRARQRVHQPMENSSNPWG
jgi:nitrate reductase gamma subunit/ferredoxin